MLKQLGRDQIDFADTAHAYDPANLLATHGLVSIRMGPEGTSYVPLLDRGLPISAVPFADWWKAVVFAKGEEWQMSRADVVLTAADQDGGAHVDGELRSDYAALRHDNSLGWLTDGDIRLNGGPGYTAIRQIAHEVLKTLIPGYSKTHDDVLNSRKKSEISEGKMRFYPHEKQFFMNNMVKPIASGQTYQVEIKVDSITTGSVRMIVNSAASEPVTAAGEHKMLVVAGEGNNSGVFGEFTDAVVDNASIREVIN